MPKGFKEAAASAKPVYHTIIGRAHEIQEEHSTPKVHDTQEAHDVRNTPNTHNSQNTQGKKGAKLPRINMAFSQENLEYLRVMAALEGQSATRYVNALVEKDRQERAGTYRAALELRGREGA